MKELRIAWILPSLMANSGGHHNILRLAHYLSLFGHKIELYFLHTDKTNRELKQQITSDYYPFEGSCFRYEGHININDVVLATHWATVEAVLNNKAAVHEAMYFVQDFEPYFAPMSSEYVLIESTYKQGLYHITSGPWCELMLKANYGVKADHIQFPIDREVYYPRKCTSKKANIIFFAKPEILRRCYELGLDALRCFHGSWNQDVEIIFFGSSHVNPVCVPFPVTCCSVLPTVDDLAKLYSNANLGIVFSTTNPSLVPYEMMACGLPVVDLDRGHNQTNYGDRRDIAFLADIRPVVMAEQINYLLNNDEELILRRKNGLEFVSTLPNDEEMCRQFETLVLERMKSVQ